METAEERLKRIKNAPIGDLTVIEVVDANRVEEAKEFASKGKMIAAFEGIARQQMLLNQFDEEDLKNTFHKLNNGAKLTKDQKKDIKKSFKQK